MAKETYYFSHDYNARNDKKISALVRDFKSSGYGIFWATCEMMHEEGGILEFDDLTLDAIAKDINEESEYVKKVLDRCIEKYKLFIKDDILLQSSRVHRNLETKNEKKAVKAEAGRLGGLKSGESRRNNNLSKQNEAVLQPASSNEPKESKVKEIKESKEDKEQSVNPINENTIVGNMVSVWMKINPKYQMEENNDYPALLNIAYKIAKIKGWAKGEVVNGKLDETTRSWEKISMFIRADDFYKKLELTTIEKKWTGLIQTMQAVKEGSSKKDDLPKQPKIVRD